ncbi:unnamed protein product [Anisakis simplex]|uniref:Uncharacterized protein n=1 Tax=Anisakis simplex TaxID=6269 RepID=A0A0M3JJH5_ANISI|nr:unnamed protein product [Anisakis simplex]VDK39486.1 unnamed protein product [Anisakis simplex]
MVEESNIFESEQTKVLNEIDERHHNELVDFDENRSTLSHDSSNNHHFQAMSSLGSSSSQFSSLSAIKALSNSIHSLTTS